MVNGKYEFPTLEVKAERAQNLFQRCKYQLTDIFKFTLMQARVESVELDFSERIHVSIYKGCNVQKETQQRATI